MQQLLIGLIRLYQHSLSRVWGNHCRFQPSCSQYAVIAIQRYGAIRGCWLAAKRILRCQPLNPGGEDPVPEQFVWFNKTNSQQPKQRQ